MIVNWLFQYLLDFYSIELCYRHLNYNFLFLKWFLDYIDHLFLLVFYLLKLNELNNDDCIFDIGDQTIKIIDETLSKCKTVLWNGPFGLFENDNFSNGTEKIAKSVANYTKKII